MNCARDSPRSAAARSTRAISSAFMGEEMGSRTRRWRGFNGLAMLCSHRVVNYSDAQRIAPFFGVVKLFHVKHSPQRKPWHPTEVAQRVERTRGAHLARTGREVKWADIGRHLKWASATITEVRAGRRPLRVEELGALAELFECSPGWLAFGEGAMWGNREPRDQTPVGEGVPYRSTEDAEAAADRELSALKRVAEAGQSYRASDAPAARSASASRGKSPKGRSRS